MLARIACLVLASCSLAQQPRFQVDVNLVNVTFTVRTARGELIADLAKEDFEVFEDGAPHAIKFFARHSDLPLTLGLLLDSSGSQKDFIKSHRRDIQQFLRDVIEPRDRAFLVCFGNYLRLVSDWTSSVPEFMDALQRYERGARDLPQLGPPEDRVQGTAFYDALYHAAAQKLKDVEASRSAVVVFSDGEDNSSAHHMLDAIEAAQAADSPVYSIRYTHRGRLNARNKYGIRVMARISRETGGSDYDAAEGDMRSAFHQIGTELRSMYELAYVSSNPVRDGAFRKVVVKVNRPGLIVRSKTGYFAR